MARRTIFIGVMVVVAGGLGASSAATYAADDKGRSDSDLMLDVVNAERGESPNAARIARVAARAEAEARRKRTASHGKAAARFWKDPFAEDPEELIPVRQQDRDVAAARHETARALAALAVARADAASARAEVARARRQIARAEAAIARSNDLLARRETGASARCADLVVAQNRRAPRPAAAARAARADRPAPVATATATAAVTPPAPSPLPAADARGIVIVPIDTPLDISASVRIGRQPRGVATASSGAGKHHRASSMAASSRSRSGVRLLTAQ